MTCRSLADSLYPKQQTPCNAINNANAENTEGLKGKSRRSTRAEGVISADGSMMQKTKLKTYESTSRTDPRSTQVNSVVVMRP